MFLFEKDLNAMELNFLVRPTLDFQDQCPTAPSEEEVEEHELYKNQKSTYPSPNTQSMSTSPSTNVTMDMENGEGERDSDHLGEVLQT